ncbi:MAG: hypothetical protein QG608_2736 [Actinomycetota bacterium]|nr:hypothetical protein [Actinomycetota bacterium]
MGIRSFAVRDAAVGAALAAGVMTRSVPARASFLDRETGTSCEFCQTEHSADHLPILRDERDLRNRQHSGRGNWGNQLPSVLDNRATSEVVRCTGHDFGGECLVTPAGTGKKVRNSTFGHRISSVDFL